MQEPMSKGHGRVQRQVLDALSRKDDWVAIPDLAYLLATGENPRLVNGAVTAPSDSQLETVRRACTRLEGEGLLMSKLARRRGVRGMPMRWVKSC